MDWRDKTTVNRELNDTYTNVKPQRNQCKRKLI